MAVAVLSNLSVEKLVSPTSSRFPNETLHVDRLLGHGFQGLVEATSLVVVDTTAAALARCYSCHCDRYRSDFTAPDMIVERVTALTSPLTVNCSHANLTDGQTRDNFDGRAGFEETLRNPIFYLGSVDNIQIFVVKMFEPNSGDVRTDHLSRYT